MLTKIFTPHKIGNVEIPNRLVVSAMVTNYAEADGKVTERFIRYHEEKAKGGWGLIIPENYAVTHRGKSYPNIPGIWEDEQIPGHKEFTDRIHKYGSKVFAQIFHAGRQTHPGFIGGLAPQAPSAIPCPGMQQPTVAMTRDEVIELIDAFGNAALRCKTAGYDGVEVHGAHGYLIAEFLSPYSNKRTDEYGGHLLNRTRFLIQTVKNIKEKCGKDFPVTFRISGDELVAGGLTIEDVVTIAGIMEVNGVDGVHISAGNYQAAYGIVPPAFVPHGWLIDFAKKVKDAVDIPVITVGRINDIIMAESVILNDRADFVAMARSSLSDPHMPLKAKAGDYEDILRCIGCVQGCLYTGQPMGCLVNPLLGREYEFDMSPAENKKKVVVAGGGITGCTAAIFAKNKGHDVTIIEKSDTLGGQFNLASVPPNKGEIPGFLRWQRYQIEKLGIKVLFNTEASADAILAEKPDAVIVTTGSAPVTPSIPGLEGANVICSHDCLAGKAMAAGTNILVIGGGMVGLETAEFLCTYGKTVTVAEMLPQAAATLPKSVRKNLLHSLQHNYGVKILTDTTITKVQDDGVIAETKGVKCNLGIFDTIVIAAGVAPVAFSTDGLEGFEVYVAGDAMEARTALEAVREGFEAAMKL